MGYLLLRYGVIRSGGKLHRAVEQKHDGVLCVWYKMPAIPQRSSVSVRLEVFDIPLSSARLVKLPNGHAISDDREECWDRHGYYVGG